jgi:hypothetical protein
MKDKIRKSVAAELLTVKYVPRVVLAHAARTFLVVSLFVVCVLSARPAEAAPVIQLMTPQSGPVGTWVAIVGSGFGASQGASTVMFNGRPVTWVSWSATSLQVQVPAGATSGNVVVTVSGKASNTKSFAVTPSPVISSLSSTSGPVGATVVVTGSNFTAGGTQSPQVVFNPELFASPISSTDTSITVAVPAGASTGDLFVSVGGGNSNSILFTVTSSYPSISSVAPSAGVVGTAVTISGTNFGSSQGTSTVTFNVTTGIPTSWNATTINVPVPTGATTGNVLVTVGGVASNPYGFEVGTAAPNITSISPASGAVATSVTIKGTGFGSTQGANTVNFNGVSGVPTSWSATQIKVPVPASATTGSVVVTAGGTVSNAVNFSVPGTGASVTSLSPSSGPVGALVTITGTNFSATQGTSTVTFNGIAVTATAWSPTSIVATVPSGATSGDVVVTVSGTASSGLNFTVVPSISSLSPTSGAGGTSVTIHGNSFGSSQGTSTVTFNGTAGTPTNWGASSITVPVPAGATTGNIIVTVGGVASNGFSFIVITGTPPTISLAAFPSPNGSGWNDTNVTITATCQAGSSPVTNCPPPQTVSTEGANQVVSLTATDANGLTATASVTLNIDKTAPTSTINSPVDGSAFTTSPITLSGSASDSLSGLSGVTCNGAVTTPSSGSFSCSISLNPGVNLVVVHATDVAGNIAASTMHLTLNVPLPAPTSLQITPTSANVLVTTTQQFTAIDQLGNVRTDAGWTVDNTNIATISTDASPILTGVAAGTVTLTASVGSISAQTQVTILGGISLPAGTILWSAPQIPAFTCSNVVLSLTTQFGAPDFYCVASDGQGDLAVQALTFDGQQLWEKSIPNAGLDAASPDGSGGLLVDYSVLGPAQPNVRLDLDALTGSPIWQVSLTNGFLQDVALRSDGSIGSIQTGIQVVPGPYYATNSSASFVLLNGQTGQTTMNVPLPPSVTTTIGVNCTGPTGVTSTTSGQPATSTPIVGPDGTVYLLFAYGPTTVNDSTCTNEPQYTGTSTLSLLTVSPQGGLSTQTLQSRSDNDAAPDYSPGSIIPDGQGGVLASWIDFLNSCSFNISHVTAQGTSTYTLPLIPNCEFYGVPVMVLGENGVAFASVKGLPDAGIPGSVISFDVNSGSALWSYQPPSGDTFTITSSADGNGLVGKFTDQNSVDTVVRIDSTGVTANDNWTGSNLGYWAGQVWSGVSTSTGAVVGYSASPVEFSTTGFSAPTEFGTNQAAQNISVTNFSQNGSNQATITNDLQNIQDALPLFNSCSIWSQGTSNNQGSSGFSQIGILLSVVPGLGPAFGHGILNYTSGGAADYFYAFSGSANQDHTNVPGLPGPPFPVMTVNDHGGYFAGTDSQRHQLPAVGPHNYPVATLQARWAILLHELGHQLTALGIQHDFGLTEVSKANDQVVENNCGKLIAGPKIKNLVPNAGPVGTSVTISGQNFGDAQGLIGGIFYVPGSTVVFNGGVAASITSWSDTQIVVTVPSGATTGNVLLTIGGPGGQSASKNFTVQ